MSRRPELILHGGSIYLGNGRWARALAVGEGKVLAAGADAEILGRRGAKTRVLALAGRSATPGFHDAHLHFAKGALSLLGLELRGCASLADAQARLREFAAKRSRGDWVLGRGWDHTAFPGGRLPGKAELDEVESKRPVALTHTDEHLWWVNSEALRRAGIRRGGSDPPHARVLRSPGGEPTGILQIHETALAVLRGILPFPEPGAGELRSALKLGARHAASRGVTSVQGPIDILPEKQFEAWSGLNASGELGLRYFAWGRIGAPEEFDALRERFRGLDGARFGFLGLKAFLDGVISDRTAALLKPYDDAPGERGALMYADAELFALVGEARRRGYQSVLHAVGDRAARQALDAFEAAAKAGGAAPAALPGDAPPFRIEHAEMVESSDLKRFSRLGAAASGQPSHQCYDQNAQDYNPARLGSRARRTFRWRSLLRSGALLAFGSDWPVMPLEPRLGLRAAMSRRHLDGAPAGGRAEEALGLEEALDAYTAAGAKLAGRGRELGALGPGMRADIAVFDRDISRAGPEELLSAEIDATVFDGKFVYER